MRENTDLAVSLIMDERNGLNRFNEPVTVGIPFPKGKIFDPSHLALWQNSATRIPLQAQVLGRWFDGSAKWILLDFQASLDAYAQTTYELRSNAHEELEVEEPRLSLIETAGQVIVKTGETQFFLNKFICKPVDRIVTNGADLIAPEGSSFLLIDWEGWKYRPYIRDFTVEARGPLRATIRASGEFKAETGNTFACFVTRVNCHAGSGFVEIQLTLHNPRAARHRGGLWDLGDEGSVYFKDLSLHVPFREESGTERAIRWTTQPFREAEAHRADSVEIYQDSSGGENWQSTNHVNGFGKVMHSFRGYRVRSSGASIEEGLRATPVVAISGRGGSLSATIEKFWQNFPKAIEADKNGISLRLFPRQYNDVFELQGGEQKTHTIFLQFRGPDEKQSDLSWVHDRLIPSATREWYSRSKACQYLSPRSEDKNPECQQLIETAIDGPQSFFARREIIDEYGWRNFGDIYADHEGVNHMGDMPLVAHYNNQYDVIYGSLVQYLRGGDARWLELASDLAKHVIDIDIYHTEQDRPSYNGGLFWHTDHYLDAGLATHRTYSKSSLEKKAGCSYGGGPSNEHNYTSGLLLYYYLTGDETARQAVVGLADWVINMDDGSQRMLGFVDRRPTGMASSTATRDYHGPGRGAGNSINALLDAHTLTLEAQYLDKAEELVRRCIHPKDDIAGRNLDDPEHRWSYLVFLQALGKYLDHKAQLGAYDRMYDYAQASLLHYADWMLEREVPYATVLHKVEIPTETWPAQDIRKCVVFHLAEKHATGAKQEAFRQKAHYFFNACITDLVRFSSHTLTRPVVLLMTNTYVHAYFLQHPEDAAPRVEKDFNYPNPRRFKPQFAELYRVRERIAVVRQLLQSRLRQIVKRSRKTQMTLGVRHG